MPALIKGVNQKDANKRALELLDYFGLADRAKHKPTMLSGGEQQRVAVAKLGKLFKKKKPPITGVDTPQACVVTFILVVMLLKRIVI